MQFGIFRANRTEDLLVASNEIVSSCNELLVFESVNDFQSFILLASSQTLSSTASRYQLANVDKDQYLYTICV